MSLALVVPGGGKHFLYSELLAKCNEFRIIKLFSIIRDYGVRETEPAIDVLAKKTYTFCLCLLG